VNYHYNGDVGHYEWIRLMLRLEVLGWRGDLLEQKGDDPAPPDFQHGLLTHITSTYNIYIYVRLPRN
jgi:hypothetical protein